MNRKDLLTILQNQTNLIWDSLCEMYLPLTSFNPPIIELNGRLYRTAGRCHQEDNLIHMGYKFFLYSKEFYNNMFNIILPHEIIHQADYNLFGLSEKKCGHGKKWAEIMVELGLPANKYHSLTL